MPEGGREGEKERKEEEGKLTILMFCAFLMYVGGVDGINQRKKLQQ